MADFAPTYMDVYDKDQSEVVVLVALTLSAATIVEGAAVAAVIGEVQSESVGGTLSVPYAEGVFAISGGNLVVGPNGGTLAVGDHPVIIVETNPYASNSPLATALTVTVTAA